MTHKFAQQNPLISRTIEVRRDQILHDLHLTIFRAFHREDEHMYEFQLGKDLNDPEGKRYVSPMALEIPFGDLEMADDKIHMTRGVCPMAEEYMPSYWSWDKPCGEIGDLGLSQEYYPPNLSH